MEMTIVLSICGPSGAGKSQLAKAVAALLGAERCSRIPTDYFLLPATEALAEPLQSPLEFDWETLRQLLDNRTGTEVSTPDFDFDAFQRRSKTGGRVLTVRPIKISDAMAPYPTSDLVVLLAVDSNERRRRISRRDLEWGTQVIERWQQLELTWEHVRQHPPPIDLMLDGTRPPETSAAAIVSLIDQRGFI